MLNRICVIFTGGTIGSAASGGVIAPIDGADSLLLSMYRKAFSDAVSFTAVLPFTMLSENVAAENWLTLLNVIEEKALEPFDGIIVTHGSDTLGYTAAFLFWTLYGRLSLPVVLVCADRPLTHPQSNGLHNFAAAVAYIRGNNPPGVFAACKNPGEPAILYDGLSLMQARQTDGIFDSLFHTSAGQVLNGEFVPDPNYVPPNPPAALPRPIRLETRVPYIRAYALQDFSLYRFAGVEAVVLELYHSGTACTLDGKLKAFCASLAEQGADIVLASAGESVYKGMEEIFSLPNVIRLSGITTEAAIVKTMLAAGLPRAARRAYIISDILHIEYAPAE